MILDIRLHQRVAHGEAEQCASYTENYKNITQFTDRPI